jgi:hypothetical protein
LGPAIHEIKRVDRGDPPNSGCLRGSTLLDILLALSRLANAVVMLGEDEAFQTVSFW